jgi:hypothetical protein
MNSHAYFPGRQIFIVVVSLAAIVLVACERSPKKAPASLAASSEKVFVIFEGPWAIVADPKDSNSVLAIAPKSKIHNELYVAASNDSLLAPGTYDLSVPSPGLPGSAPLDPTFAQVKIDAQALQHALDDKSQRYVIRLPKPEAYVAAKRFVSRVGASYPPDASTEQNHAAFVSFQYSVGSLNGFSVAGTPDIGTFNPLLLQLETPTIRFGIEPNSLEDFTDLCHKHSRSAFRDTVKFLGLTLYVDFPNDPASCHNTDPQIARSGTATYGKSPSELAVSLLNRGNEEAQSFNSAGVTLPGGGTSFTRTRNGSVVLDLMVDLYFFHMTDGSCKAPILFLTATT